MQEELNLETGEVLTPEPPAQEVQKVRTIRTQFNYVPKKGRTDWPASKTVPKDGLSVRDILKNHTAGASPAVQKTPEYSPEDSPFSGMDVKKMDLQDLQNLERHITNLRTNATNEIKRKQKENAEKQAYEAKVAVEKAAIEHFKNKSGQGDGNKH